MCVCVCRVCGPMRTHTLINDLVEMSSQPQRWLLLYGLSCVLCCPHTRRLIHLLRIRCHSTRASLAYRIVHLLVALCSAPRASMIDHTETPPHCLGSRSRCVCAVQTLECSLSAQRKTNVRIIPRYVISAKGAVTGHICAEPSRAVLRYIINYWKT